MASLVLTVLRSDRAGVVSTLARVISDHGGSWERSQMAHVGDSFGGIVEVEVPDDRADALVADIEALAAEGLQVTVERSEAVAAPATGARRLSLHLVGADHPGIVAEVSALLAEHAVNVEELSTDVVDAPMAGGKLFEAHAVVALPEGVEQTALAGALEALADELMVDLDLHEGE